MSAADRKEGRRIAHNAADRLYRIVLALVVRDDEDSPTYKRLAVDLGNYLAETTPSGVPTSRADSEAHP